jgi:Dolichyl-phosphate-mannose-protein mannosyltransferase
MGHRETVEARMAPAAEAANANDVASGEHAHGAGVAPTPLRQLLTAAVTRVRGVDLGEALLVSSLMALCVTVRVLRLTPVDIFWDAGAKWHFVRQWSYGNNFSHGHWSHHMARFGVNIPAYFAQRLFGTSADVYYVAPIALFTLGALFVYLTASRLGGRSAGILGGLLMAVLPGMDRTAAQLLPDGIAGTAAVIGGYAFVRFCDADGKQRQRWLFGVGLACVWAYAVKESSVLMFPGVVLAVFLSRRSYKEALILVGLLALYGLLETAGFRLFTPYANRLAVVEEEHGLYPPVSFWGLFGRFFKLEPPMQMLFWLWLASVLHDLGSNDKRRRLFLLLPLGFVFCLTFFVRRIDPIIQWESFKPRYMAPGGPLFVTSVAVFASDCGRGAYAVLKGPRLEALRMKMASDAGWWTFVMCVALGLAFFFDARPGFASHPLVVLRHDAGVLNDAFRRNLPIVEHAANPRGLNTVYAVYMRPEYLAQSNLAKGGSLPDIWEAVRFLDRHHHEAFLLRDDSAYGPGEVEKLMAAGCAIVVTAHQEIELSPQQNLPETCKAPRGEPIPRLKASTGLL